MPIDLDAYFARIGHGGGTEATPATLAALHEAQAAAVAFENIDVLLGRTLDLSAEGIAAKVLGAGRGGYCYEQNLLLAQVLRQLGFAVDLLAARVRMGYGGPRPRTHALMRVTAGGRDWVADCGFGLAGLLVPLELRAGASLDLPLMSFRLSDDAGHYVVQAKRAGEDWSDLYAFTLEPQQEIDFVMANHFTTTWPRSPFIRSLIVARVMRDRRLLLLDNVLSETTAAGTRKHDIASAPELFAVLARDFGLAVNDPQIAARVFMPKESGG